MIVESEYALDAVITLLIRKGVFTERELDQKILAFERLEENQDKNENKREQAEYRKAAMKKAFVNDKYGAYVLNAKGEAYNWGIAGNLRYITVFGNTPKSEVFGVCVDMEKGESNKELHERALKQLKNKLNEVIKHES